MDRASDNETVTTDQHLCNNRRNRWLHHRDILVPQISETIMHDTRVSILQHCPHRTKGETRLTTNCHSVFNAFGDATPGPRHLEGFHSCGFPWRENIDAYVNVPSVESFRMSMHLSREGLIAGPSSGQALKGLLDYLGQLKEQPGDKFKSLLAESGGEISCVFTCNDLPYQYLPQYFDKLGEDEFPQIQNKVRLGFLRHNDIVST